MGTGDVATLSSTRRPSGLVGLGMTVLALTACATVLSRIRKGRERKEQARRARVERISRLLEITPPLESASQGAS
jgi:hypothetical protein